MPQADRRIALLQRVVRLREVEKRRAAARLAEAQGMHGKLLALEGRSAEIAATYSARRDAGTADELARTLQFTAGVQAIRGDTASEARKAGDASRAAMAHLHVAERRQKITADALSARQREDEMRRLSREPAQLARKLKRPS
ncbi:hypothetical protein [Aurantiacibacter zhengii]|uniref:Flagellar FliJ protein n=1 Tax=Aurantiacibacter zhengii TaxID=2307003 RepID=A0A418NRS5_9SPHN|nr:hypothetical protein [Aurantiacibacter zhengii]RIV85790.1 hypothetical protein D2V07_10720 [Aurantiacibacter zhengii]